MENFKKESEATTIVAPSPRRQAGYRVLIQISAVAGSIVVIDKAVRTWSNVNCLFTATASPPGTLPHSGASAHDGPSLSVMGLHVCNTVLTSVYLLTALTDPKNLPWGAVSAGPCASRGLEVS